MLPGGIGGASTIGLTSGNITVNCGRIVRRFTGINASCGGIAARTGGEKWHEIGESCGKTDENGTATEGSVRGRGMGGGDSTGSARGLSRARSGRDIPGSHPSVGRPSPFSCGIFYCADRGRGMTR